MKIYVPRRSDVTKIMNERLSEGFDSYRVRMKCKCNNPNPESNRRDAAIVLKDERAALWVIRCKNCAKQQILNEQ